MRKKRLFPDGPPPASSDDSNGRGDADCSNGYELQILEAGRTYSSHYEILENDMVEICFYGCPMVLLRSGQTVTINPEDSVPIDSGVMSVAPARWERRAHSFV